MSRVRGGANTTTIRISELPHYTSVNFFNGLHGRSIPVATGIKATKPELTVIVVSGDGCIYGEGGNRTNLPSKL